MTEKTVAKNAPKTPAMKLMKKPAEVAAQTETQAEVAEKAEAVDTSDAQNLQSDDLIVKTVHEIENMKEEKALKLVPQLLDNIDHDYFRLGGVLAVIQAQGWYMDKGHENFRSFVETECGMAYRKSMYLIAIYNGLVESGVLWDQVKHLGWTKLKELASILTTDNVEDWVTMAEGLTVLQLQEHIKAATAGAPTAEGKETTAEAKKTTTITFKLHQDQKETVREALDKAKHESGTDVDSVALENICLNFLGGESKLAKQPTLAELMTGKSAEEVLGVFSEIFPNVTMEVTLPE